MLAIGIMSGTSLDGIDVCVVDIKKNTKYEYSIKAFISTPYSEEIVKKIKEVSNLETSNVQKICSLNVELSYEYVKAINECLSLYNIKNDDIEFIAMHGQTIWHNPDNMDGFSSSTLQIGDPSIVAYAFNKKVISNFRMMDMAAGGCGAPLIPFVDYLLYNSSEKSIAMQNIGGIGNVCYMKKNSSIDEIVAFDTGPGNMMIDEAMKILFNKSYDENGNVAKEGNIDKEVLNELLSDEYLKRPYPKSTGREKYNTEFVNNIINKIINNGGKKEDVISTITAFTAYSIIDAYDNFLEDIDEVIVSGGGSHNDYLMDILKNKYKDKVIVENRTDAFEAFGFAILGHMTLLNEPSNVPVVTNAKRRVVLGNITNPPYKD